MFLTSLKKNESFMFFNLLAKFNLSLLLVCLLSTFFKFFCLFFFTKIYLFFPFFQFLSLFFSKHFVTFPLFIKKKKKLFSSVELFSTSCFPANYNLQNLKGNISHLLSLWILLSLFLSTLFGVKCLKKNSISHLSFFFFFSFSK